MNGGWELGIENELGDGSKCAQVWVVGGIGVVRLIESKFLEDLGEVSKRPGCSARFCLLEGFEQDFLINDERWGGSFGVVMDRLVVGGGVIKLGTDFLIVGVHCGLGHSFGEVTVAGVIVVFISGLLC